MANTPATESGPRYSPDGRALAFVRTAQTAKRIDGAWIALVNLADLKVRDVEPLAAGLPAAERRRKLRRSASRDSAAVEVSGEFTLSRR